MNAVIPKGQESGARNLMKRNINLDKYAGYMKDYIKKTVEFYEDHVDEYIKHTEGLQDTDWLKKFVKKLNKNSKVLDLGCAFGRDTQFFLDNKFDAYGVDLSKKLIEKAKIRVPTGKFQVASLLDLPFEDDFFDAIWCSATLLHLSKKDVPKALSEMQRVLKTKGILYLHLKEGKGEKLIEDDRYKGAIKFYSYFSKDEISTFLDKANFTIIDLELIYDNKEKYRTTGMLYIFAKK